MKHSASDRSHLDHGYAWVITIAVFFSNLLMVGYFRSFSVFFVDIVETFQTTYALASIILGVQGAVCCASGLRRRVGIMRGYEAAAGILLQLMWCALIAHGVLLDILSLRTVAFGGALIFSAGIVLAYFAQSTLVLVLTLGVLVGLGNGCAYGPGLVLVGQHFEKRRALATSLACMGSSVGSMTLPVVATELLDLFGLRGSLLVYGGLTLHLCVTTALYRSPPQSSAATAGDDTEPSSASTDLETSHLTDSSSTATDRQSSEPCTDSGSCSDDSKSLLIIEESETALLEYCKQSKQDSVVIECDLVPPTTPVDDHCLSYSAVESLLIKLVPDVNIDTIPRDFRSSTTTACKNSAIQKMKAVNCASFKSMQDLDNSKLMYFSAQNLNHFPNKSKHQESKRHGSLTDLTFRGDSSSLADADKSWKLSQLLLYIEKASMYSSQPHLPMVAPLATEMGHVASAARAETTDIRVCSQDLHTTDSDSFTNVKSDASLCQKLRGKLSCDGKLLRNPAFWMLQLYTGMGFVGSQAAYSYLPSLLQEKGLSKRDLALALTLWGAFSLVGRFLTGVMGDRRFVRPTTLSAVVFFLLGALFFLVAWLPRSVVVWLSFTVIYGLLEGVYICLLPVVIIELLGLQHFAPALGFSRLSQSICITIFFPVLGQLRDEMGDYHATFYLIGSCCIISGSLFVFSAVVQSIKRCCHKEL